MFQNIPNAKIVGIPGNSHDVPLFATDYIENLMLNFFQGNTIINSTGCNVQHRHAAAA